MAELEIYLNSGDEDFMEFNSLLELNATTSNGSCYQIDILDDSVVELNETFLLQLFSNDSAVSILMFSTPAAIQDDDGNVDP